MSHPRAAEITEIDITGAARTLSFLRWSDYLILTCGLGLVGSLPDLVQAASRRDWQEVAIALPMSLILCFTAYAGWRHIGVIDPRAWPLQLCALPLLFALAVLIATSSISELQAGGWKSTQASTFNALCGAIYYAGIALPAFVCVLILQRQVLHGTGMRLTTLLTFLRGRAPAHVTHTLVLVSRGGMARGITLLALALLILLAVAWSPTTNADGSAATWARASPYAVVLAAFFIIRARRHFQIDADALLAIDKRAPVLFLRSFNDDDQGKFPSAAKAVLDVSLELRLANHFRHFGPFIAIGSPKDKLPQLGAARVRLGDDVWQERVLDWMRRAQLIVMYGGSTQWVNWELRKIVESGRASNFILMLPELKARRASTRRKDIAKRVENVRRAFGDTEWSEELLTFSDYDNLRAMLFRPDGSMLMIKSRSRSREAYHLAALVAHQQLLTRAAHTRAELDATPVRRWPLWVAGFATVALAFVAYASMTPSSERVLRFQRGTLHASESVPSEQAQRVGSALLANGFFSATKATHVYISQNAGTYLFRFVVKPEARDDEDVMASFSVFAQNIGHELLSGAPLDVMFIDADRRTLRLLPRTTRITVGRGYLYYALPISAAEADAVGRALTQAGYFNEARDSTLMLSREGGTPQLRYVIDPQAANDPGVVAEFEEVSAGIANSIFEGHPLLMRLCDAELNSLHERQVPTHAVAVEAAGLR
jgi:hypothetical protein